jgi:hypothetical protein
LHLSGCVQKVREDLFSALDSQIEKTDSMLNGLLADVNIITPTPRENALHTLIDGVLKNHQSVFEKKRARLFKEFEKDLPETAVPGDRMKYILESLVQYAWGCLPLNGSCTIVTRFGEKEVTPGQRNDWIEVLLVYTDCSRPTEQSRWVSEIAPSRTKGPTDLEFLLAQDTLLRNRGSLSFEADEMARRTILTLRLPVERRRVTRPPAL